MTGFGAASREAAGLAVRAEVRSVNNRGLSVSLRAPSLLDAQAPAIDARVKRHAARGTVTISVTTTRTRAAAPSRIARAVVEDYAAQAVRLAEDLQLRPPGVGDLLRLPGALEDAPAPELTAADLELVLATIDDALAAMVAMREREGAALDLELRGLLDQLEAFAGRIETLSPAAVLLQRDRLRERLAQLLAPGQAVPEELVAREVAVLADRTDVAEEVARLRSHVAQTREALGAGGPVGRRLDFLSQEFGRETNTIGSKCQDAEMTKAVVDMKVVVERFKEQAANLE